MSLNGSSHRGVIPQASAIPFRWSGDEPEFCLITSLKRKRWGFPKGIIDPGETYDVTALKEAHEEAGLHGSIVGEPLGEYEYRKWGAILEVTVVLMEVHVAEDTWEESEVRDRQWVTADAARSMLHRNELVELLDTAMERISV